jgi:hypothetical protein
MYSTTMTLQPATMATKLLTQAACYDVRSPIHEKSEAEVRPVRIDWVVVTDANGNRRLQMHWRAQ